jgi:hypothetical protein
MGRTRLALFLVAVGCLFFVSLYAVAPALAAVNDIQQPQKSYQSIPWQFSFALAMAFGAFGAVVVSKLGWRIASIGLTVALTIVAVQGWRQGRASGDNASACLSVVAPVFAYACSAIFGACAGWLARSKPDYLKLIYGGIAGLFAEIWGLVQATGFIADLPFCRGYSPFH